MLIPSSLCKDRANWTGFAEGSRPFDVGTDVYRLTTAIKEAAAESHIPWTGGSVLKALVQWGNVEIK